MGNQFRSIFRNSADISEFDVEVQLLNYPPYPEAVRTRWKMIERKFFGFFINDPLLCLSSSDGLTDKKTLQSFKQSFKHISL